jgi:hypothetical protein
MILELAGGKDRGKLSGTIDLYRAIIVSLGFEVVEKNVGAQPSSIEKDK